MSDRKEALEVERRVELDEEVDTGCDIVERVGPAPASSDAAVLEVPRRHPVRREVDADVGHERAVVARAPVAAVEDDCDGVRPDARGDEKLPDLAPARAVGVRRTGHAPGRIRTCGLALRRRALYPLSYGRGSGQCIGACCLSISRERP